MNKVTTAAKTWWNNVVGEPAMQVNTDRLADDEKASLPTNKIRKHNCPEARQTFTKYFAGRNT
jgi:hypothetical protein